MNRRIVASDALRDAIRHLSPILKGKVKESIEEILRDPSSGKELRDDLAGLRSYRVGQVRIIYQADRGDVTLVTIGPRKTVYQKAVLEWRAIRSE